MYFASQFPVIIKKTSGVLVKGIRGRGKGIDIETLQKPLPLVRGRGKGKSMACCTQGYPCSSLSATAVRSERCEIIMLENSHMV